MWQHIDITFQQVRKRNIYIEKLIEFNIVFVRKTRLSPRETIKDTHRYIINMKNRMIRERMISEETNATRAGWRGGGRRVIDQSTGGNEK